MKKLLLALAFVPLAAFAAIKDWNSIPYISYNTNLPSPSAIIGQGRNFELLQALWENPRSLVSLQKSGFDFSDIDTSLLMRQGMIYSKNDAYHSAVPFIDSVAMTRVREKAKIMAKKIVEDTKPEMQSFMATLDNTGFRESAFPLVHSLVFDGITWNHLNVSHNTATIAPTDSMSWNGIYYFFRPEGPATYGTNGISIGNKGTLYFSWGDNSNAYLCTAFITTNIRKALASILNAEALTSEMERDCREYGVTDENGRLMMPVIDGNDAISKSADMWAQEAACSFLRHFDVNDMAETVGLSPEYEATLKVILYHEILFEIDSILDQTKLLPIPEMLKAKAPDDKKKTATVAYIEIGD